MERMNEKKDILEQHKINGDTIQIIFIYPNVNPIFYKGKVKQVNKDNFVFLDIIDGEIVLAFSNLQQIKVLERGKNGN